MVFTFDFPFIWYLRGICKQRFRKLKYYIQRYTPTFKGGTFITDVVVQCFSLLHSFVKENRDSGSAHCRWMQIFDNDDDDNDGDDEIDKKANIDSVELKLAKLWRYGNTL